MVGTKIKTTIPQRKEGMPHEDQGMLVRGEGLSPSVFRTPHIQKTRQAVALTAQQVGRFVIRHLFEIF
jgi:hypothetical protein